MNKENAYIELRRLVEAYVSGDQKQILMDRLDKEDHMPPVRGVIDIIFDSSVNISREDEIVIAELMHFFG